MKERTDPIYYPVFLSLSHRLCVVVGGGRVAERKARGLLAAGASVRLISPAVTAGLSKLALEGTIEIIHREYHLGDLEDATLVFGATDNKEVNRQVKGEALHLSIPANIADDPDLCDFIVPSLIRKPPLLAALSTSGLLPGLSRRLRREILSLMARDYPAYARRVGAFRKFLLRTIDDTGKRRRVMKRVSAADISEVAHMTLDQMKKRFLAAERV